MQVVPSREPTNESLLATIRFTVNAVIQNGPEYEYQVVSAQKGNALYDFIHSSNDEGYYYYRWALYCMRENLHQEKLDFITSLHQRRIASCNPGYLDLTTDDSNYLRSQLIKNNGGKDSIRMLRTWILSRAHSIRAISYVILAHIKSMYPASDANFNKVLHTLYVVNDVFFNGGAANMLGPYTRFTGNDSDQIFESKKVDVVAGLFDVLDSIMQHASSVSVDGAGQGKLFLKCF